ncbi:unnamed protein product, partial [Polarella glacialis]
CSQLRPAAGLASQLRLASSRRGLAGGVGALSRRSKFASPVSASLKLANMRASSCWRRVSWRLLGCAAGCWCSHRGLVVVEASVNWHITALITVIQSFRLLNIC